MAYVSPGAIPEAARAPSRLLLLTEGPRALGELAAFVALQPLLARLPRGDGHGVLVLPGFLVSDAATRPLRSLLSRLGYHAVGWELGRNVRIDRARTTAMAERAARLCDATGRKISIVGWSLGGILAREIARQRPDLVRQVISLGSPLSGDPAHAKVGGLFERFNRTVPFSRNNGLAARLSRPPPVPSSSIYARGDGVVAWRSAIQHEGPQAENIAVCASHCGLTVNPLVMVAIADRLAQPEGEWQPFRPAGWRALLFPRPHP